MKARFKNENEIIERINRVKHDDETISQFVRDAVLERLKRIEARDKRARLQNLANDTKLLEPIVRQIVIQVLKEKA